MKFFSPEFALHLYKFTIWPCMEYYSHVWAGAPSCYLDMLDNIKSEYVGLLLLSLAVFLEPLAHCATVASLSLFYRFYFAWCPHIFELPHLWALSTTWASSTPPTPHCRSIHKAPYEMPGHDLWKGQNRWVADKCIDTTFTINIL